MNRLITILALVGATAACGGGPATPSSGSGSSGSGSSGSGGSGGGASNKTVTVTVDNVAFVPTLVTAVRSNPGVVEMMSVSAVDAASTNLTFSAPTQVGTFSVNGAVTARGMGAMTVISGATPGGYLAFLTTGSGSVTISAITAAAVVGRVDLVLAPTSLSGPGKTVSGTFNVAF